MVSKLVFSGSTANGIRLIMIAAVLLSTLSMTGCPGLGPIEKAVEVIDNGIRDIGQNSASWQAILQRVANQLPQEISETLPQPGSSSAAMLIFSPTVPSSRSGD
jgi:hypothetical protein